MQHLPSVPETWDAEADVVVVGFGAAGFAAAVTAHELGAEVVILEKAPDGEHGGNTRVAGQGYLNTSAVEPAIAYLTALCGPYTVPEADDPGLGGGNVPQQRLAAQPRRRSAGAPAPAGRHRVPRPAGRRVRAQVSRRPDLRLFLHLAAVRAPDETAPDPHPV